MVWLKRRNTLTCPACGSKLPWAGVRYEVVFRCPNCGEDLQLPRTYGRDALVAALVSGGIGYLIGCRGWFLVAAIGIGWFPVIVAMGFVERFFIAPTPEIVTPRSWTHLGEANDGHNADGGNRPGQS